jgi:hypothetical protein
MELPCLFVVVEISGQVESSLPQKQFMLSEFKILKFVLSLGVALLSSFFLVSWCVFLFFCISSCLL